ncbi:hypothetical protein OROHE_020519 [Orobanche hederae]
MSDDLDGSRLFSYLMKCDVSPLGSEDEAAEEVPPAVQAPPAAQAPAESAQEVTLLSFSSVNSPDPATRAPTPASAQNPDVMDGMIEALDLLKELAADSRTDSKNRARCIACIKKMNPNEESFGSSPAPAPEKDPSHENSAI